MRIDKAEYNFLPLGPANGSAVKRFAIEVQNYIESEKPIPPSALGRYIAERITDEKDRQDFIGAVAGDRGSGKSYTCLSVNVVLHVASSKNARHAGHGGKAL